MFAVEIGCRTTPCARAHSCPPAPQAAILLRLCGKDFSLQFEPRGQFEQRQKKLEQIQALGLQAYPHEFRWSDTVAELATKFSETPGADLEANQREVRVARPNDSLYFSQKAGFAHLTCCTKRLRSYLKKDVVGESRYEWCK